MAKDQKPQYLWIGCSDSRVDPNELTNTDPGELFVHRNIANLVIHTDLNLLSVLQYAVAALKVQHIIICGHYGCGGVRAATKSTPLGVIDNWINGIRDTYALHKPEFTSLSEDATVNRLVELNVMNQVKSIVQTPTIQQAWAEKQGFPVVHGWIYDLSAGMIKPIVTVDSLESMTRQALES